MRAKQYEVRNTKTGELIATGTATQCAMQVGIHPDTVRRIAAGYIKPKQYLICEVSQSSAKPEPAPTDKISEKQRLAAKWDAFCEPIRKKYGIPIYTPPK